LRSTSCAGSLPVRARVEEALNILWLD
jgi:hypothetical protein